MTVIAIPKILQDKLTPEGANALVELLTAVEERSKDSTLIAAEGRFEKSLAEFEVKIERRLSDFKTDLIKWMIGISIGQMTLILAIISAFFRRS